MKRPKLTAAILNGLGAACAFTSAGPVDGHTSKDDRDVEAAHAWVHAMREWRRKRAPKDEEVAALLVQAGNDVLGMGCTCATGEQMNRGHRDCVGMRAARPLFQMADKIRKSGIGD